jgi:putative tryptophan/tyrosine transport system substrate-binding protein
MIKNRFTGQSNSIFLLLVLILFAGIFQLGSCTKKSEDSQHFSIGLVTNNPNGLRNVQGFKDSMEGYGYIEGENVTYIYTGQPIKGDELNIVLESMVEKEVDLIFTAGTPTGVAAHRITRGTSIPVVFGVIADPIAAGVMEDLIMPGGNITGVKISQNQARRLELLLQIAPDIKCILVPYNPEDTAPGSAAAQIKELANELGIEIKEALVRTKDEALELLSNIPEDIDAIFMLPDSTINPFLAELIAISINRKLPLSGPSIAQVEGGALTAYGIIHERAGAQAGHIADQILKGVSPGVLPVETAEFYLGINLQMADSIGLEITDNILKQAEIIIRLDKD